MVVGSHLSAGDLSSSDLDGWPTEVRMLLGPSAAGLLAAVANEAGATLSSWRPRQVDHQPGRFTVVQYRTTLRWVDGETTSETLVAATGERIPPNGAAIFGDGDTKVAVWRWMNDPFLPGLASALDSAKVSSLLDDFGIGGGTVQLRTMAYRPARRAVVEATGRHGRLFLKMVRPDQASRLHELHRLLSRDLPVPSSLGWTDNGVVVQSARMGTTLRQTLRSDGQPPPTPDAIVSLLDRLPSELAERPPRRDLLSAVDHYARGLAVTVPSAAPRLDQVLDGLRSAKDTDGGDIAAVHGDLYEAQILVDRGKITGLLDVDTAGAGRRIDDLANFCAHLSVLAQMSDRPRRIKRFGADLLAHAEQFHPPDALRPRIAAAVVGLATGPFRVLERGWAQNTIRRLDLAQAWLTNVAADR